MFKKFAIATVVALATAAAGTMAPTPAEAGNTCKSVNTIVVNHTGNKIKIMDLDYWNPASGRLKSEPIRNKNIRHGQTWSVVRNLEQVNARNTYVRIEYKERVGRKWSAKKYWSSGSSVCGHGAIYRIKLR